MSAITKKNALWIFQTMLRIRRFEESSIDLFTKGELPGFLHAYIGEEAIASGICVHLTSHDQITSTHRGHGHMIAKGLHYKGMFSELYAKQTGYCKGKGGSMHIADQELGVLGANGIVGGGIPIASGAALGLKLQKTKNVVVCFFGDGASNEGAFHEGINLASTWELPVVFVCENNGFAESTPQKNHQSVSDIADRAKSYNIPGIVADGMDPLSIYEIAGEAIKRARSGKGPTLIEAKTMRFLGHYVGDPGTAYGHDKVVGKWKKMDPIVTFENFLLQKKWIADDHKEKLVTAINQEIDEAILYAKESPEPDFKDALEDVYSDS